MDIGVFLFCLIWIVLCGLLGFFIGDMKGHASFGALLGVLLGPIGLLILAVLPSAETEEREERVAPLPAGMRATAYPTLESPPPLPASGFRPSPRSSASAPKPPRFYICNAEGDVRGPFGRAEIARLREKGDVNASTLFCLEGEQKWKSSPTLPE